MNGVNGRPSGRRPGTKRARRSGPGVGEQAQVAAAWERFVAGDDSVQGVRPNILLSWYRCRDVHKVNPDLDAAPEAHDHVEHSLQQGVIFTKLGGAAGAAAERADLENTLVTVTDGVGVVLATWGPGGCLRHAADTSLAQGFAWSEASSGTNGMGTALERPGLASVRGAEHWCHGFHRWTCSGIAIRDPVSQTPLAALNVSRWGEDLPETTEQWLRGTAAQIESELREETVRHARVLADAFTTVRTDTRNAVLAVDVAGKVVVANEAARDLLGVVCPNPAIDPNARLATDVPNLAAIVGQAVRHAQQDAGWQGFVQLDAPHDGEVLTAEVRPVRLGRHVVGMLVVGTGAPHGEPLHDPAPPAPRPLPRRVAALRGNRIVLLSPDEIRYAEADCHAVWLMTTQGRLRAATRGIDNVERELGPGAFLRIHRRFVVNVGRIREIEAGFKGALTLTTSSREYEAIPVSRRRAPELRRLLGL